MIDGDPEVQELTRKRDHLKRLALGHIKPHKGTREYNNLQKSKQDAINARKRRTYALLKAVRQAFNDEQAVIDIER